MYILRNHNDTVAYQGGKQRRGVWRHKKLYNGPTSRPNFHLQSPKGYSQKKFGGDVRPASQNPYHIYDQNLRFSLPYLWPDQKFYTLSMTVKADTVALKIIFEELLFMVLSIMSKE